MTRITYKVPIGRSALEVVRNYQTELEAGGFDILFKGDSQALGRYFSEAAGYDQIKWSPNIPAFTLNGDTQRYLAAQKQKNGAIERYVVIYAVENNYWAAQLKEIKKGQVLVQVDVVDAKPMESAKRFNDHKSNRNRSYLLVVVGHDNWACQREELSQISNK